MDPLLCSRCFCEEEEEVENAGDGCDDAASDADGNEELIFRHFILYYICVSKLSCSKLHYNTFILVIFTLM